MKTLRKFKYAYKKTPIHLIYKNWENFIEDKPNVHFNSLFVAFKFKPSQMLFSINVINIYTQYGTILCLNSITLDIQIMQTESEKFYLYIRDNCFLLIYSFIYSFVFMTRLFEFEFLCNKTANCINFTMTMTTSMPRWESIWMHHLVLSSIENNMHKRRQSLLYIIQNYIIDD